MLQINGNNISLTRGDSAHLTVSIKMGKATEAETLRAQLADGEDGKLNLCWRTGEAEGGAIVLQYLPHELVSHYFVEVN